MKTIKTKLLLCAILLASYASVQSQDVKKSQEVKKLKFNFNTKSFDNGSLEVLEELKQGDFYQISVENINQNIYRVFVTKADSFYSPALTIPTFASMGLGSLSDLLAQLKDAGGAISLFPMENSTISDPNKISSEKNKKLKGNSNSRSAKIKVDKELTEDILERQIISRINLFEKVLNNSFGELQDSKKAIGQFNDLSVLFYFQYFLLDNPVKGRVNLSNRSYTLSELIQKFQEIKSSLYNIEKKMQDSFNYYKINTNKWYAYIQKNPNFKSKDSLLRLTVREIQSVVSTTYDSMSTKKLSQFLSSIIELENNVSNSYTSMPLQFQSERNELNFSIIPIDTNKYPSYRTTYKLPLSAKHFLAVSSGFYWSSLQDENYSILPAKSGSDTTYSLIKEDASARGEMGMKATLVVGERICKHWYFQGEIGPGVSINKTPKPRLLLGGGFGYGYNRHKILFNCGMILGFTNKISTAFKEKVGYINKPTDYLVSKFTSGYYISVGYGYAW